MAGYLNNDTIVFDEAPNCQVGEYLPTEHEVWNSNSGVIPWSQRYIENTDSSDQPGTYRYRSLLPIDQALHEAVPHIRQYYSPATQKTDPVLTDSGVPSRCLNGNGCKRPILDVHSSSESPSKRTKIGRKAPARCGPLTEIASKKQREVRALKSCWRCRMLKKSCDGATPCKQCISTRRKATVWHLGCRRDSLADSSPELVPIFFNQFGVSVIRRGAVSQSSEPGYDRLENPQLLYSRVLNGLRFCTSDLTDHLNCKGVQLARELLGKATDYASRVSTEDQIILQSIKYFSMVMNIYCVFESKHRQKLLLPTLQLPTYDTFELQALARTTLEIILSELQAYLFARKKEHWVRTFYSFCIVLLAAEVTQMNMALDDLLSGLRGTQWVATSHAMERCVSEVLVPLFKTSNRGFDPLIMDMNKKSSVSLLDNDEATVEEYKRLQRTMASYKEFWDLHSIGPQVEERSGTLKPRITGRFIALLVSG